MISKQICLYIDYKTGKVDDKQKIDIFRKNYKQDGC